MLSKNSSEHLKTCFFLFFMIILVFQNFIQQFIPIFQYADELIAVYSFLMIIFNFSINKFRVEKNNLKILLVVIMLCFFGIFGTLINGYQTLSVSILQMMLFIKFYLVYLAFDNINIRDLSEKYKMKICSWIKRIIIFLFILTIANYVFKIWPLYYRYNFMVNNLFYSHATYLVAVIVFLMCGLNIFTPSQKVEWKYTFISLLIVISTLRVKGILFVVLSIIILLVFMKNKQKIAISKTIFLMLILLIVGWNQFENYFFDDGQARTILLKKSINVANDHFPFGSGFGTYGSYMSSVNYSPLYYKYGLNTVYGLEPVTGKFICDSFWPMILAEFGYIGLLGYIYIVYLIYKKIQNRYDKKNYNIYINKMLVLFYLLISSSAEQAFVSPLAIPLAILLSI